MDSVDIDPGDGGFILVGDAGIEDGNDLFSKSYLIVIDEMNINLFVFFLAGLDQ